MMSNLNLPVNCFGLLQLSLSAVFLSSIFEFLPGRVVCATCGWISMRNNMWGLEVVGFKYGGSVSLDLMSQTHIDHNYNINEKEQTESSSLTFVYDTMGRTKLKWNA
ncbi:hypothetical protein QL285_002302 [Trifolium repens]|nr:hypothetical protein QL285_002302 [Trifolium repens]